MLTQLEQGPGLDIVLALQEQRSPFLDGLAVLLHNLGATLGFLLIITLVFWSLNRHLGTQLLLAMIISGAATGFLKLVFQTPRPTDVSPLVIPLVTEVSFGLPSGHMLMNSFVWGYAAYRLRRRWIYVVLILYLLLLAWSRMYAGVHFPQDVVGGLLLGLLGLWLYITYIDRATGLWNGSSVWLRLGLALAAGLIILFFPNYDDTGPAFAGMLIGTALGFELEAKYVHFTVAGSQGQRILRYVLGIVLLVIVYYGLRKLEPAASAWLDIYRLLLYSLTAFVAIFFWPWLAQRIGLFKAAPQPE